MKLLSIAGFTSLGYRWHARQHEPIRADLTGKTVLITGGSGGLGLEAASSLATLGARVAIVGRSDDKLEKAVAEVDGEVVPYRADLSLMSEIRSLAAQIVDNEERLDVLVNNVGVLLPEREVTSEGLEKTFATDLAGHFLLTNLLIPRLVADSPSRIINVTSGGMYAEKVRPDDLQNQTGDYKGTVAYARAKRGQVILTKLWAGRLVDSGVFVAAMHPGWAKTPGVSGSLPVFNAIMGPLLRTPAEGADTIVWLAASPDPLEVGSGQLWFDRAVVPEHLLDRTRETGEERKELWVRLEDVTGAPFPELN